MIRNNLLPGFSFPAGLFFILTAFVTLALGSCSKDEKDDEKPVIDMQQGFPLNCDTIYRGQNFSFRAVFTDNFELGAFSLDIHHNFDHHSHSTDLVECPTEPVKQPMNPMLLIRQFDIPDGIKRFEAEAEIFVPEDVDIGDYHFMVRLTDKTGWQTIRGISIKIGERQGQ
jgi:hypothetical protein